MTLYTDPIYRMPENWPECTGDTFDWTGLEKLRIAIVFCDVADATSGVSPSRASSG